MQRAPRARHDVRYSSLVVAALVCAAPAHAHSVRQRVGGYTDNQGLTRQRIAYDVGVDGPSSGAGLTASSFNLLLRRDSFQRTEMEEQERDQEVYGSGYRVNDQASITAAQTWDKITETRIVGSYSTDREVSTRTWGAGASQWMRSETVRISYDLSRTVVEQPFYGVLDFDSREIADPTIASTTGSTVGVRHLARATTIVDYTASFLVTENRPSTKTGAVAVRQFVTPLDGAVHGTVTRAYNRGYISTDTTYGQVDAWIFETAYLQNLWRGAMTRLGYRYYKEDETTRAYEDRRVFGSDTLTAGLSQELPKGAIDGLSTPLVVEAAYGRYLSNADIAASTFELGIAAKL